MELTNAPLYQILKLMKSLNILQMTYKRFNKKEDIRNILDKDIQNTKIYIIFIFTSFFTPLFLRHYFVMLYHLFITT